MGPASMSLETSGFRLLGKKGPDLRKTGDCAELISRLAPRDIEAWLRVLNCTEKGPAPKAAGREFHGSSEYVVGN